MVITHWDNAWHAAILWVTMFMVGRAASRVKDGASAILYTTALVCLVAFFIQLWGVATWQ